MNLNSRKFRLSLICSLTIVLVLLFSQYLFAYEHEIKILSTSIADNIAKAGKKRIAVVDFTDLQGNITELGRFLAEELSVDLTNTAKGFEVIDRNHLNRILAEHKLSLSGIVDQKTVQKLGQIAGVDALITGSITPLERSVRVVCKVIATDTARVISAAKGDIPKTKAIEELFGRGIGTGTSVQTTTTPSKPQTKVRQRVEVEEFSFEVEGCKLTPSAKRVTCSVLITNFGKDRMAGINNHYQGLSRIIDATGNEYGAEIVAIGKNERNYIEHTFPSGVPTKLIIVFENVSPEVNNLALLEIDFNSGRKPFKAQLRNIPLSR